MSTCVLSRRCALEAWRENFKCCPKVCWRRSQHGDNNMECQQKETMEESERRVIALPDDLIQ